MLRPETGMVSLSLSLTPLVRSPTHPHTPPLRVRESVHSMKMRCWYFVIIYLAKLSKAMISECTILKQSYFIVIIVEVFILHLQTL